MGGRSNKTQVSVTCYQHISIYIRFLNSNKNADISSNGRSMANHFNIYVLPAATLASRSHQRSTENATEKSANGLPILLQHPAGLSEIAASLSCTHINWHALCY